MNKIIEFLKMKYEQLMMRKFDRILEKMMRNKELEWYPDYILHKFYPDSLFTTWL